MKTSVAAAVGAGAASSGVAAAADADTVGAPSARGSIKRFATTSLGAEVTGPFVFDDGTLLFSHQHPSRDNPGEFSRGGIGYVSGFDFRFDGSNDDFAELPIPTTNEQQSRVRVSDGEYVFLAQQEDEINGGAEQLGVPETPDGVPIDRFAGSRYSEPGYTPDCNQFIPTNEDGTEGLLYTNFETSPGNVTRIPISRTEDGEWEADLENAINLANTEPLRALQGTRINCAGELTPWGTMISSEEEYAHPTVSLTATVSDILEKGTGQGLRGARPFWNRPNPTEIQSAVASYAEADEDFQSWYVQGYWALSGVELLAYYNGAEPVDQRNFDEATAEPDANGTGAEAEGTNTTEPIGEGYPNPYRQGYHVDFRDPAADPPTPVKYYVMGRGAWEMADIVGDRRTVYETSDGDAKGIYKFVADELIDGYDDPMDLSGTLYAPKITNASAAKDRSPANVPLDIEWIELGHATNREVESWIAEYDGITQVDYLETHAETDWRDDLDAAIEEADREVIENGNRNYITDEEIVEWAEQYEERGPEDVDEELRKVPFLETRAAAKEIGASIEFNKAEGVDSVAGAGPGDFVYFGLAEYNDALSDDEGDLRMDRVDGGVVYRGQLKRDYDITRLEPVVVGFDGSDSTEVADQAPLNIDNVYVMNDGRVLCCEDADQLARSFKNDCMWVYQPNVMVDAGAVAVRNGTTGTLDVTASSLPAGFSGARVKLVVSDPEVASIESVSFPEEIALTKRAISDDGSTATLQVTDATETVGQGGRDVTLATLTVRGTGSGTADIDVTVQAMDDEDGDAIDAEGRAGLVVTGPPAVAGGNAPRDLDGDGDYADVNGNGRLDYADVTALFRNFDGDSVRLNKWAYDFNDNGQLDFDDVVDLYEEVN